VPGARRGQVEPVQHQIHSDDSWPGQARHHCGILPSGPGALPGGWAPSAEGDSQHDKSVNDWERQHTLCRTRTAASPIDNTAAALGVCCLDSLYSPTLSRENLSIGHMCHRTHVDSSQAFLGFKEGLQLFGPQPYWSLKTCSSKRPVSVRPICDLLFSLLSYCWLCDTKSQREGQVVRL
jgi:hypothetical protein